MEWSDCLGGAGGPACSGFPGHRDRQRGRPARGGGVRIDLGELPRGRHLRVLLGDQPLAERRWRRALARAARMGQPGTHDAVLLRCRPRAEARVRHGRAQRAKPSRRACARSDRRSRGSRALVSRLRGEHRCRPWLGDRDGHRHSVRAGRVGARGSALVVAAPRVRPHARDRRRYRRADRDRRCVYGERLVACSRSRDRDLLPAGTDRSDAPGAARARVRGDR